MKKIIQRTCIGCNNKKDKREFIRIVLNKENGLQVDKTGKTEGRGAYICNNIQCLEKAIKNSKLEKILKVKIDNDFYDSIKKLINNE